MFSSRAKGLISFHQCFIISHLFECYCHQKDKRASTGMLENRGALDREVRHFHSPKGERKPYLSTAIAYFLWQCYGCLYGRNNVVGVANRYGRDGPDFVPHWWWDFSGPSRPALRLAQPPVQWVDSFSRGQSGWSVAQPTHSLLAPKSRITGYSSVSLLCFHGMLQDDLYLFWECLSLDSCWYRTLFALFILKINCL